MDDTARKCGETLNNAIKVQDQLLARIRELEEALRPFADAVDDDGFVASCSMGSIADYRRARAVLDIKNPPPTNEGQRGS